MNREDLQAILAALGWTQEKLANELGVARVTVARYLIKKRGAKKYLIPETTAKHIRLIAQSNSVDPDNPKPAAKKATGLPGKRAAKKKG